MGILSSIGSAIQSTAQKTLNVLYGTTSKGTPKVTTSQIGGIVAKATVAVTAPVAVASGVVKTISSAPVVVKAVQAIAGTSTKTKVVGAVAGLIGAGAVSQNPSLITKTATIPSGLVNIGSNIGTATNNPSKENLAKIFTDNPVLTSGLTALGIAGAVKTSGLGSLVTSKILLDSLKDDTTKTTINQTLDTGKVTPSPSTHLDSTLPQSPNISPTPILPQTVAVKPTSTTTKHKKHHPVMRFTPQSQSVRVNIYNQSKVNQSKSLYMQRHTG